MPVTQTAVARLMKEFKTLQANPIVGASASPVDDSILEWKLIVVGAPPYDFPIRIHLDYSDDYPNSAPKAYFETRMPFIGGASMIAPNGLQSVCMNIFGNFASSHTEWKSQQSGWTPAYTIETIITSLQGLMMEDMLSRNEKDIDQARKLALEFKCSMTGHDGSDREKWWPPVRDGTVAHGSEDTKNEEQGQENAGQQQQQQQEEKYFCYVLKACPEDNSLGYGVSVEGFRAKSFTSPCEILSKEAFNTLNVRHSSTNKKFDVWIPLLTPFKSNFQEIEEDFSSAMKELCRLAYANPKRPNDCGGYDPALTPLHISLSIMNSLVVEVMNASNNLTANDKFIEGYFAFLRLLQSHCEQHKEKTTKFVDKAIKRFIEKPIARTKMVVPNLGEFILYTLLSSPNYTWSDIAIIFIDESHARNVFWYAVGHRHSAAPHPELKNRNAKDRCRKVFLATETSRRLICYQAKFISMARSMITSDDTSDHTDGGPFQISEKVKAEIKALHGEILKHQGWSDFYNFLEVPFPDLDDGMEKVLLQALDASANAGYHR